MISVKVYTKPQCVQCNAVKRHLERLEARPDITNQFSTEYIQLTDQKVVELRGRGFLQAPYILIEEDGTHLTEFVGYRPDEIDKFLVKEPSLAGA